jgi:hypothetical protein
MTAREGFRGLPAATKVTAVAAVAAFAVLAPIRMAQGMPKTRFAVVAAGVTAVAPGDRAAAAAGKAGPEIPPAPGQVVGSPFPLSHLGVRWTGSETAAIDIRVAGPDGVWGPWRAMPADHDLEAADHDLEEGDHDLEEAGGPVLSQLIRAHGATRAQVRAAGEARDVEILGIDTLRGPRPSRLATATPAGAADDPASASDGDEDRGSSAVASSSTTTTTMKPKPAAPQPPVITRAGWGADESIRKNEQKYAPVTKLFVHHTVTSPDGADPDPAATVRAIYAYHVQGNGWDDIGYNFLIDAQGRIYEGRWARDYASGEKPTGEDLTGNGVVGAHVLNHNAGSAGVAMLGDFTAGEPTPDAREALVKLMAWKADRHDIDAMGNDPFTTSEGVVAAFPNLSGHRDAGQTACPGNSLYPLLPGIRESVAAMVTAAHGPTTGYWTATADGRVLSFGDAPALGSMAGKPLSAAIVGMAATPTGKGYWLLGSDGGIFSFGDARFYGSTGSIKLNKPVVGMAPTPTGRGYWLVASDGGIFAYGDAVFFGSTGSLTLNKPVVSMAPGPNGKGYWLVASDGGLFAFGVPFFGSVPGARPENYPGAVQMRATSTGKGYYIGDANGGIAAFGDARFLGADTSQRAPRAAVDLVLAP